MVVVFSVRRGRVGRPLNLLVEFLSDRSVLCFCSVLENENHYLLIN